MSVHACPDRCGGMLAGQQEFIFSFCRLPGTLLDDSGFVLHVTQVGTEQFQEMTKDVNVVLETCNEAFDNIAYGRKDAALQVVCNYPARSGTGERVQ
jgi:hypothetical protein